MKTWWIMLLIALYLNAGLVYLAVTRGLWILIFIPLSLISFATTREVYLNEVL